MFWWVSYKQNWFLHLCKFRWGKCKNCKHWRTNMIGPHTCGYCDFMDSQ